MSNYGDQFMTCPECGGRAESDAVDVGVGLYIAGNFACACGWEITADGRANVATYDDWFPDYQPNDGWISLGGYFDPPTAPIGFVVEVKREPHMGIVTDYRFTPSEIRV